jgi:hypothetical protein
VIVKINQRELDRLRRIEAATRAFADAVKRAGQAPAISRLLNRAAGASEER